MDRIEPLVTNPTRETSHTEITLLLKFGNHLTILTPNKQGLLPLGYLPALEVLIS